LVSVFKGEDFLEIDQPEPRIAYDGHVCYRIRAPTTLKSEGEVTSLSGADKREVRDNREKW